MVSLREVKEGLARQAREEAEGRERKRKWIMTGGSCQEEEGWERKRVRESPEEGTGWLAEFC